VARLTLSNVTKRFGDVTAVRGVDLDVNDGELLAVLGPSGCGKTTLLRLIAGFEQITGGAIVLGGQSVSDATTHVPAERRRVGIVFQSYALWPHMTVAENVGYPLRVAGISGSEHSRRVRDALDMVGLADLAPRAPAALSGGQQQRVALARCFVMEPSIVLLDEPLANLDVHLRASMQDEFIAFHERTRTTMLYITHDQAEAMALADRIAVMDHGRLVQLAAPAALYREPGTKMVADFIGQGAVVEAEVLSAAADGHCAALVFGIEGRLRCAEDQRAVPSAPICLRPENLAIVNHDATGIAATVRRIIYQGGHFLVEVAPACQPDATLMLILPEPITLAEGASFTLQINGGWVIPAT
jgi:iron(III) transport system ATP-binding protein